MGTLLPCASIMNLQQRMSAFSINTLGLHTKHSKIFFEQILNIIAAVVIFTFHQVNTNSRPINFYSYLTLII